MALTAAERAKKYRQRMRLDPTRREQYLERERKRKREAYKPIGERTQRSKRLTRRQWRKSSRSYRKKQRDCTIRKANNQKTSGRKKVKSDRAKAYRDIQKENEERLKQTTLLERWKKRHSRLNQLVNKNKATPRSKTKELLKNLYVPDAVRKNLFLHNVLTEQLREKYITSKTYQEKRRVRKIVIDNVTKKHRCKSQVSKLLGANPHRIGMDGDGPTNRMRKGSIDYATVNRVQKFMERDDNSRLMPGKKDTITRKKIKKQKRLRNDSLKNLYCKFLSENSEISMHYATFCRLKPWWVVKPSQTETCMCKRCSNIQLMYKKLKYEGVITSSFEDCISSIVCDTKRVECMYGKCESCKSRRLEYTELPRHKKVSYEQWVTKEKTYGDNKTTKVTVKDTMETGIEALVDKFESELKPRFLTHRVNITRKLRKLKQDLDDSTVVVHVDFSENYLCRYAEEIQSVHFGASHQQASLHTGVWFTSKETTPFCTMSECTRHDPSAIWGHLEPVLRDIRTKYPNITSIHFISDGPTTQYRNKVNFWFAGIIPKSLGFNAVTWNFLEAGHGKGAPDGVGGVLKRTADALVAQGKDVSFGRELFEKLQPEITVQLTLIPEEEIAKLDEDVPSELVPVEGTMRLHQVLFSDDPETVKRRDLTCFCSDTCECYNTKEARLKRKSKKRTKGKMETSQKEIDLPIAVEGSILRPLNYSNAKVDDFCVVRYDGKPYPGRIRDVDEEEVEVISMARIGRNSFFWPLYEDCIWYSYDDILTWIPEPKKVTNRHQEVDPVIWAAIDEVMGVES